MSASPLYSSLSGTAGAGIASIVSAVGHIKKMRGGSQAHLMRASDGHAYVTKYANNPQSPRLLANELLAGLMGLHLGLPMPPMCILDVNARLIENTPDLRVEGIGKCVPCSSGLQFGSRYAGSPEGTAITEYLEEEHKARLKSPLEFARVMVLDKWTANTDGRQAVFTRKPRQRKWRATFIDQGYCFDAADWAFPDQPLHGVHYRNWFYSPVTGWESFEPTLTLARETNVDDLWRYACVCAIPSEWYQHDRAALSRLLEALDRRRALIPDLIIAVRESPRDPFPNWTERSLPVASPLPVCA